MGKMAISKQNGIKMGSNSQLDSFTILQLTTVGYFSRTFANSGDGVAEIYWCTKADCSDEKLAQIVKFTITASSIIPSIRPVAVVTDMKI